MLSNALPEPSQTSELLTRWGLLWGVPHLPERVVVRYSVRQRASAGRCRPTTGEILLNAGFLAAHPDEFAASK